MKMALLLGGGLIAVLLVMVVVIAIIGASLPRHHTVSRSARIGRPIAEVHAVARDFAAAATWRPDLTQVDLIDATHFREHGKHGVVVYEIVEDRAERIVTRIASDDLGYSGSWTYRFESEDEATRLTITEDGDVSNVAFRFVSRFFFSSTETMDRYLDALQRRCA